MSAAWAPDELALMRELHEAHVDRTEIARRVGRTVNAVAYQLWRHRLLTFDPGNSASAATRPWRDPDRPSGLTEAAEALLRQHAPNSAACAAALGVSTGAAYAWLGKLGLRPGSEYRAPRPATPPKPQAVHLCLMCRQKRIPGWFCDDCRNSRRWADSGGLDGFYV